MLILNACNCCGEPLRCRVRRNGLVRLLCDRCWRLVPARLRRTNMARCHRFHAAIETGFGIDVAEERLSRNAELCVRAAMRHFAAAP